MDFSSVELWNGIHPFDNTVRLLVVFAGFTLAMTCLRFALIAYFKSGQRHRVYGILSYGLVVLAPAVIFLFRFDLNLYWPSVIPYALGLLLGAAALRVNYTVTPAAWRLGSTQRDERDAQDTARGEARGREDVALTDDRLREDNLLPDPADRNDRDDMERVDARDREDVALTDDRLREDDLLTEQRGREDEASKRDHDRGY